MSRFFRLSSLLFALLRKFLFLWVRSEIKGADSSELNLNPDKPICYVLQYSSMSARLVLEDACLRSNLPSAQAKLKLGDDVVRRSFFFLYERQGHWFRKRQSPMVTQRLKQIVKDISENDAVDVQIVPVSLFWGRSPDKENSWLKLLLTENWTVASPFQKLFIILLHGRQTFVQFSQPISLRQIYQDSKQDPERGARKAARILRVHFRRIRQTVLGPDLSHRQNLVHDIVNSPTIVAATEVHAQSENITPQKARHLALKYGDEIAANLQIPTIRVFQRVLSKLWNKIYNGIESNNIEIVRDVTKDHAVIYVPCHRSHIDYLVLSSILFGEGIMVPHIAAGINLNIPIVGSILRRGGAFFLRRTFKGNKLYAAVFAEYIHTMLKRGFSLEYFVEGGRSRTGRTLKPKSGMVAMTVSSFLREQQKPFAFVPVYFGYEKVLEGASYLGELRGKKKEKESIFGLFKSLKNLRKSFGKVNVNFGEPIYLEQFLDKQEPNWRDDTGVGDEKPEWFSEFVEELSIEIATRINSAAALNPTNLMALVLLSTQRHAMDAKVLANLMSLFASLLQSSPYSEHMTFPQGNGADWLEHAENLGIVDRKNHVMGDIICLQDRSAVALTYNRNNILHFFAVPSLIASLLQYNESIEYSEVHRIFRSIYPYIKSELFLRWTAEEIDAVFEGWLDVLIKHKLLSRKKDLIVRPEVRSAEFIQLSAMARFVMQTLERYYISIAVLIQQGPGKLDASELEQQSTQMAERMSILFGLNAPEFFDKALFRNFIGKLQDKGFVHKDENDKLFYEDEVVRIADNAGVILNSELRQAITQITTPDDA